MGIFKSNDVRGIYPDELSEEAVEKIGFCLPELLGAKKIVVGRDGRRSSDMLFKALCRGINKGGADVADIGCCDTPALYFASAEYGFEGAVMITASHNPPDYNGLKISREKAIPVGSNDGLAIIEKKINGCLNIPDTLQGNVEKVEVGEDYISHLLTFAKEIGEKTVVVDCSEGAAGYFINELIKHIPGEYHLLFDTPDGDFPNRDPDPLKTRGREHLIKKIADTGADLGVCFDGDADRAVFFDENGTFVSPDVITALLGGYFLNPPLSSLKTEGNEVVFYDIRSSNCVKEFIAEAGGSASVCRTGHSHIKKIMRERHAVFAGELSGHYYFRDNYFCDSGFIAFLAVLSALSIQERTFGEIVKSVNPYSFSGEINFVIEDVEPVVRKIEKKYSGGKRADMDGIRFDFDSWWFILRFSTAEPVLRLVVEADSDEEMQERIAEISEIIFSEKGKRV